MKKYIYEQIIRIIQFLVEISQKFKLGRLVFDIIIQKVMQQNLTIKHNNIEMKFCSPNNLNLWRIRTFSTKEPETLEWIEKLKENSVIWDIGANIGLYSIYAAKVKNCNVFSFEPSVFNLELLARNIWLNGLTSQITIIPIPLNDKLLINKLNMSSTAWGGALSTFGKEYGHDGESLDKIFEFSTIGIPMDDLSEKLNIPLPDYIKMDVDGIEQLILKGGEKVLKNVKEISVEINENFKEQFENSTKILTNAGLELKTKKHSEMIEGSQTFRNTYNQIWIRKYNSSSL